MSRVEIEREGAVDYSVPLPRALLRDARLSFGARGLFAFLWDLPRGWILRLAHLIWMGPEGRDALRSRLRELERVGAIRIEPLRDTETGRLAGKRWILVAADRWAVAAPLSTEERKAGPSPDDLTTLVLATVATIETHQATPKVRSASPVPNNEPPTILAPDPDASFDAAMVGGAVDNGADATPSESSCGIRDVGRGFFKKCLENPLIAKVRSAGIGSLVGAASSNPLIYSQQLGMKILDMVGGTFVYFWILVGVAAGLALVSGPAFPSAAAIVGAGINLFGFLLGLVLLPLAIFAIQLIAYVPLMLTIAWIMAVGAWIVVVAESLIAATLWALAHLDPEGEGMGQRTAHGYIFMLNLLFRPSILVFSAFFAQRFCGVLGSFANDVMSGATAKMMTANEDSLFLVLIMMAAGIWITTVLNIKIVGTAASLLNLIPNQVFTWIGGQYGSDVGSGMATTVADTSAFPPFPPGDRRPWPRGPGG